MGSAIWTAIVIKVGVADLEVGKSGWTNVMGSSVPLKLGQVGFEIIAITYNDFANLALHIHRLTQLLGNM